MMPMNEASIAQKREELKRRLIQLKHARTCTTGDCTVDYCNRTKALLAHVSRCANAQCTTIGCKSTRQLLSHFRKCRNLQCDVCSAIRPPMNENEQQLVLRRQQERLCMLRHASTCTLPQCVLPYCAGMKVLWKHICECHQRQCRTDHCISSRYVLSHFKQCNKMICEVCGPVRKAIKIVDSCRANPGQLQMITSQCPETVRGLIKIMNTTLQNVASPGAAMTSDSAHANQMKAGVNGGTPTAGKLQMDQMTGLQSSSMNLADGVVKLESNASAQNNAGGAGKLSVNAAANNALAVALKSPSAGASGANVTTSSGVDMKSSATGEDSKKKPLKLQTEKEKKMRRKEQAKIAKARVQARAQAASAGTTALTPAGASVVGAATAITTKEPQGAASTIQVLPNGLVVRGRAANLRNEHHVSHQDISFLDSMTEGQLDEHIRSLRFNFCGHITLTELKNRLMPLLTKLMDSEYGWTFNNPVDPVQWNIPDYFDIIKCPMDLGTIKKRLENEHYNSVEAFAGDVRLVFENCIAYNSSTNKFNIAAKQLLASFNKALASLKNQLEKQLFKRCEQRREEMCQLCGGESFKFAPCMLFCSGPCGGRIRRHTHYYSDPRGEHHWCSSCYKQMKDGPIDMSLLPQLSSAAVTEGADAAGGAVAPLAPFDGVLKKSSLVKRKNSEVAEEPWVECDSCKLWYHQICALFNERNHAISGEQEPFVCPICVKKQRAAGVKPSLENGLKARRLPITRMAKLIETRVLDAIATAHKEEAVRMGKMGNSDSIGFSSGVVESTSETQFGVTIREVLSVDKQVQIKPKMGKLLAEHYGKSKKAAGGTGSEAQPKSLKRQRSGEGTKKKKQAQKNSAALSTGPDLELTYRSRCICVFQELDGVDVLIFTLYVQEYGPDSLDPNAGRVYVSYLDSVNYFQPKKLRTLMHQHVMLGFLEDCKNRGFHTCHIWSCPPLKGDDYIFFCKPENQKIPKSARLRQWYQKLLQEAKKEGLVINISNLYAEYYLKKKAAHELPYFEGDYWPRLAEDLIKQLEEKGTGGRSDKPGGADDAASAGANASLPPPSSLPSGSDSVMGSGATTPVARSPTPSDASAQSEGTADDPPSAAATPTAAASKASVNAKSKSKRTKKGAPAESSGTMTRSSASKARSKKGGKLGRANGSSKTVVNSDPLMQKLKGILEPQKDDFFVVDLHPKCHKCASPIVHVGYWELKTLPPPVGVTQLVDAAKKTRSSSSSARNSPPRHYHHYYCVACHEANKTQLLHRVEVAGNGAKRARELSARILPLNEKAAAAELAELDLQEIKFELKLEFVDPRQSDKEAEEVPKKADNDEKTSVGDAEEKAAATVTSDDQTAGKDQNASAGDAAAKTDGESNALTSNVAQSEKKADEGSKAPGNESSSQSVANGSALKSTPSAGDKVDDDVIMPCEIFDTREAFLLYCQNNHCQFDQIRRAKHSSMMVLYHLFNQGTTGFTFNCTNCKITLLSGNRWNCSICPLFNLCDACNAKTKHEHTLHSFKVVAIPRLDDQPIEAPTTLTSATTGTTKSADGGMTREPGSSKLKRAKVADTKDPKGKKGVSGSGRKRKLGQTTLTQPQLPATAPGAAAAAAPLPASTPTAATASKPISTATTASPAGGVTATPVPTPAVASSDDTGQSAASPANGNATAATSAEDAAKKQRRIHNIDPQLLLQLEHASSCTVPNCTFFNCARMQAMLKHGAICEQRLAGPCVLCKRIVGLLSAHARQCTKEYAECKVPRCGDIRRHFLQQMQQRQQQLLLARQQQQQQQQLGQQANAQQPPVAPAADAAKDATG